jgi:hypothetical protein
VELELELDKKEVKGEKGDKPVLGIDYFTEEQIINIKESITPVKGADYFTKEELDEIKQAIKPIKGVDYFDGTDGNRGEPGEQGAQGIGIEGKQGESGKPPKHEILNNQIRFENPDGTWGNWIRLGSTTVERSRSRTLHRGGLDYIVEDLSSQCNGVNMVFTVSYPYKSGTLYLSSTQYPIVYRKDIDFIESGQKEVTLVAAQVGPPQADQTLMVQYIKT